MATGIASYLPIAAIALSVRPIRIVFIDGLSSLSSNLLIYEVLLIFIALSVIGIGNLGGGVCALGGLT